jgi:hypothetical protein
MDNTNIGLYIDAIGFPQLEVILYPDHPMRGKPTKLSSYKNVGNLLCIGIAATHLHKDIPGEIKKILYCIHSE